jgi:hypothetical protein
MISVIRCELYRMATIRSALLSVVVVIALGLALGFVDWQLWALLIGASTFTLAVVGTSSHFQHRTATLLYLGQPRRLAVLLGQTIAYALLALLVAAAGGVTVLAGNGAGAYPATVLAAPAMAVLGAACATIIRRVVWTLIGAAAWFVMVEGLLGRLRRPLPFTLYVNVAEGDHKMIVYVFAWALVGLAAATLAIRRDVTVD